MSLYRTVRRADEQVVENIHRVRQEANVKTYEDEPREIEKGKQ